MDRGSSETDSDSEQTDKTAKPKQKKSLAKDMKEKFAFLRRRHTDTALSSKDGKLPRPSTDTVLSWSKSFDTLLQDKYGLDLFREFLRTEFSEENIEFWISCEEYKTIKSNKLTARAQQIYTDFVAIQAPREINLDSKTRESTGVAMSSPDRTTFEVAQKRIQALMDKDSYPRFLRSDVYQELLGDKKAHFNPT